MSDKIQSTQTGLTPIPLTESIVKTPAGSMTEARNSGDSGKAAAAAVPGKISK